MRHRNESNLAWSFPEEKKVLDRWVFVLDRWVFVLDRWVFVLDRWVFVLDQRVFVLDHRVLGLRSPFLGLRFRHIRMFSLKEMLAGDALNKYHRRECPKSVVGVTHCVTRRVTYLVTCLASS